MKIRTLHLVLGLILPLQLFAVDLDEIRIYSHLHEPFSAEIPLIDLKEVPLNQISAAVGSHEDFTKQGLNRDEILSHLEFQIKHNQEGHPVVTLTSRDNIHIPYMEMIVNLSWPEGQLSRSFTVLLDPLEESSASEAKQLPEVIQQGDEKQRTWFTSPSDAIKPAQGSPYNYGPTLVDETIWQIAKRYQLDTLTLPQVVLALVDQNPDAFEAGNLNGLKVASKLIVPSIEKMKAVPIHSASQEVEAHDLAWRTHSRIQHVLIPPYMQEPGSLISLVPSLPAFQVMSRPVSSSLPHAEAAHASANGQTTVLLDRLKSSEVDNSQLKKTIYLQEQENKFLRQKLEKMDRQVSTLPVQQSDKEARFPLNKWLLLVVILLIGLIGWTRYYRFLTHENESDAAEDISLADHEKSEPQPENLPTAEVIAEQEVEIATKREPEPEKIKSGVVVEAEEALHLIAGDAESTETPQLVKSKEALDVLLQLAKTYISRGDLEAAMRALKEVISFGDTKQKKEAKLLFAQLEGKHSL